MRWLTTDCEKTMTEDITALAQAVASQIRPAIPVEIDLWSAVEVAAFLKRDIRTTREKIAALPGFPQAIRLPAPSGGRGHPLWKAREVIAWAEKYQEDRVA
jgi:hypothetical protein